MKTFNDLSGWRAWRRSLEGRSLGFVPTLGGLHAGHAALIGRSVRENESTAVSIYLNPTQFDQQADLDGYAADRDRDLEILSRAGVDAVLLPTCRDMYPDGYRYRVVETELARRFCGAHRPGHFEGVLTVVMKLLNLVRPRHAYFGEKDYQQLQLVRGLVEAFFMDVEIVGCSTVREPDGLAMSTRNLRLGSRDRALAPLLHRAIAESADAESARRRLEADGFDVEYVEDFAGRRLAAARLGTTRLIDNVALEEDHVRRP